MSTAVNAAIITIGDELLIGQTIDTNSAWMAQQLNAQGIAVRRRVAVGDDRDSILNALGEELEAVDVLFLTGGLGPTADDITKPLLAEFFGGPLEVNEAVLEHVKNIFATRKRPFLDRNMAQAEVPASCTVLHNRMGTAPGMWFERDGKITVALPGVPYEMMTIMTEEVLPRLKERFYAASVIHHTLITAGEGESFVAHRIEDLEAALPSYIKLAYLPSPGIVKLRLTAEGTAGDEQLEAEIKAYSDRIAARLDQLVVATEDFPLERVLADELKKQNLTLSLAESCTGGYLAHLFTQLQGAGTFLKGSAVVYTPAAKETILNVKPESIRNEGVVSETVARELADGTRNVYKSDIGIGITGYLDGSDDERVPDGTVCFAVSQDNGTVTKTSRFHLDRLRNKELAAQAVMLFALRTIRGNA